MTYYSFDTLNLAKKSEKEKFDIVIDRIHKRTDFHILLYKLVAIAKLRGLRLIIENPATTPHYLLFTQNFIKPSLIDKNRLMRGDYFKKPTAYWFINCEHTIGYSIQRDKKPKTVWNCKRSKGDGLCSEERSMISSDYARNFICDFILGKEQDISQKSLFDF